MAERAADDGEGLNFEEVNTDDENDEIEYEGWKVICCLFVLWNNKCSGNVILIHYIIFWLGFSSV